MDIHWNSDGTAIAFVEHGKGLNVFNMTTDTVSNYYTTSISSQLHDA